MTGQVLTKPLPSRAHVSKSLRFSQIHSFSAPIQDQLLDSAAQQHPPAPGRPFPPFLPPWRQRWLLSSMSSCKGTQEDTLGFTSSAGFSHSRFLPFGEGNGKKQMEAACELSIGSHCRSGTWGDKTESAARTAPERWLLFSAGTSLQPKCPLLRGCDMLQANAAPGSGLAPSRPADASSSSSPGWPSCVEHRHRSQTW